MKIRYPTIFNINTDNVLTSTNTNDYVSTNTTNIGFNQSYVIFNHLVGVIPLTVYLISLF